MEKVKRALQRLSRWEYLWLCLLVVVTLAIHFSMVTKPATPAFDEYHYVNDARDIINREGSERTEHPPLGKLIFVAGIKLFGDNPIGWRFFPIIFGTISIVLFYLICRRLGMSRKASNFATFLLAFENLTFIQSSVAMLDVYSVTFMLAAFFIYLTGRYTLSGPLVALSGLAKLNGILVLPAILLHMLISRKATLLRFLAPIASFFFFFLALLPLLEFPIFYRLFNPLYRIWTMWVLSGSLTFDTVDFEAASRPWDWLIKPVSMAYYYEPHYISVISYTLWALIIPSMLYLLYKAIKGNNAGLFGISWFVCTYLIWIPANLITDRISFVYYFYPTVGAVSIGLGLGLAELIDLSKKRLGKKLKRAVISLVSVYLLAHLSVFAVLSPLSTWWSVTIPK